MIGYLIMLLAATATNLFTAVVALSLPPLEGSDAIISDNKVVANQPSLPAHGWNEARWLNGSAGMIRREFIIESPVRSGYVYASTIGFHELRINGIILGGQKDKLFEPGVAVYPYRAFFTTFNITTLLNPGQPNVFGALLGNGPSAVCGTSSPSPCSDSAQTLAGTPKCAVLTTGGDAAAAGGCKAGNSNGKAFRAIIALLYSNGTTSHLTTAADGSWRTAASPMIYDDVYAGERWDARRAEQLQGFWKPHYTASATLPAAETTMRRLGTQGAVEGGGVNASATMTSSLGPPIRVTKRYVPLSIDMAGNGLWTFDFGTTLTGVAELTVSGPAGALVKMDFAVMLMNGVAVVQFPPQTSVEYILSGNGRVEVYQQRFCWFNFRYITLNTSSLGSTWSPSLATITAYRVGSDTTGSQYAERGQIGNEADDEPDSGYASWYSSNDVLNRYHQLSVRTQLMNMMSIPMDTPDRERHGWTGDSQLQLETGLLNLDTVGFARNWLMLLRDQMDYSGWVTDITPNPSGGNSGFGTGSGPPDPAWTSTLPNVAFWTYKTSGNMQDVHDNYPHIVRWLNFYTQYMKANVSSHAGLVTIAKWCDYLTFEILFGSGVQPSLDFGLSGGKFFMDGLRVAERFATLLGKDDEAERWGKQAKDMAEAYTRTYLHTDPTKVTGPGLFLRQTSYVGYATPCSDWICWYDSSWNVVPALRTNAGAAHHVSLQTIPETGLQPCKTNSNQSCPWYLVLMPDRSCSVALDNGTASFARAASWKVVSGLSNVSAVSFQSVENPSLYLAAAEPASTGQDVPAGSRMLRALSLSDMGNDRRRATWSVEQPNIIHQTPPVPLPTAGKGAYGGWHSFRSQENRTAMRSFATSTSGNLSTLAAVGNTQTLTALALGSRALSNSDQLRVATVLLNDLLSEAQYCAKQGSTAPPQQAQLCWNSRGHNSGGMVGIKAILDALQQLGRSTELLETLSQTEYPSLANFVVSGATALWSDWSDRMTASGEYFQGAKRCNTGCTESYSAAWLSLAVKYYYTVFAGILQPDDSAGYASPLLSPNIPWADVSTGTSYGGPARSLDFVRASMQTVHGRLASAWKRDRVSHSVEFEFVVPNGSRANIVLPVAIPRSNVTVIDQRTGDVVYPPGRVAPSDNLRGLNLVEDSLITVVGSYVAVELRGVDPGHHEFKLSGAYPAHTVCASTSMLSCPYGMVVMSIEQAAFGQVAPPNQCGAAAAVNCSAGSTRFHVEKLCLNQPSCDLSKLVVGLVDPIGQLPGACRDGTRWDGAKPTLYVQALCGVV